MEGRAPGVEGLACFSVEDRSSLFADAINTHPRDPSNNGAQKKAIVGWRLLGKGLMHFSGGWQYQKCKAVGGCFAIEICQIVGAVVGHLHFERKVRHFGYKDAVFRYEAAVLGHEVGDRSTHPIALRELP